MKFHKFFLFFVVFSFLCANVFTQEVLKSSEEDYYDFLSLQGITNRPFLNYRTMSDSVWILESSHVWENNYLGKKRFINENKNLSWKIFGPYWFNSVNTAAPYGQNDGALWQGRGYNTRFYAGARFESYGFEFTLRPELTFSQNAKFDIIKAHSDYDAAIFEGKAKKYGYYGLSYIDAPQRFGDKPLFAFDWGDSEVRYSWRGLTLGFGTQSIWLGPAKINPIIHSNNSASYPKFDLGLRRTAVYLPKLGWHLGDFEFRGWWGRIEESDFFDNDSTNNFNLISGVSFAWELPYIFKGFSIGFNHTMLSNWNSFSAFGLFRIYVPKMNGGDDNADQRFSFTFDYVIPKIGMEIYLEWARNDFSPDMKYVLRYPFHTQGWTFGAEKTFTLKNNMYLALLLELTYLECSADYDRLINWTSTFYAHNQIKQGYTNRGQWLGAGIGTGGNSQYLGLKLYYPRGSADLFVQRRNPDLDYTMYIDAAKDKPNILIGIFNAEANIRMMLSFGISSEFFITKGFSASAAYVFTDEMNPLNKSNNDRTTKYRFNNRVELALKYRL